MSIQTDIEARLAERFAPSFLSVENESRLHSLDRAGETHFKVVVVTDAFEGLMILKRHRLVQETLAAQIASVRAVSLHTFTPKEWNARAQESLEGSRCVGAKQER